MQPMTNHLAFMFFKGSLLKDPKGVLEAVGKNSRHGKRVLLTSVPQINKLKSTLKAYVKEAIALNEAGVELPQAPQLELVEELADRPYVLVGFLAWLILVPLGITSVRVIRKKMGKYWRKLHKLTYVVVILGWLHLLWLSRSDVGDAVFYGVIFGLLLGYRVSGSLLSGLR